MLVEDESDVAAFKDYQPSGASKKEESKEAVSKPTEETPTAPAPAAKRNDHLLGPAARLLLESAGLSVEDVQPSGPHGIVTKGDVLAAIESGTKPATAAATEEEPKPEPPKQAAKPAPAASPPTAAGEPPLRRRRGQYVDVPNSQIRKIIASRLSESKSSIPHLYLSEDVDIGGIAELRAALKSQGIKVSVNDCVIKAVAGALKAVPAANFHWDEKEGKAIAGPGVDISVAVATDKGLITPIVRSADAKALPAVSAEIRELAGRARANKLKPEEFQGGSFSVSNLGMFGIDSFSAIINPPQVG